jgi:hypothetical protein
MSLDLAAVRASAGLRRWAVTIVATIASSLALDVVATTAGLVLATSAVLSAADHPTLLALLGMSYAAWALGLRANLRANVALLQATGTSTNALSKAAYDVVARRTARPRVLRAAASVGYVAREVAMEVPYYVGAFGAALTDAVSSRDALVFIIGANLGAAAYEYGLARATHAVLRRRSPP